MSSHIEDPREREHSQQDWDAQERRLTPLGPPDPEKVRETFRLMAVANAPSIAAWASRQYELWGGGTE